MQMNRPAAGVFAREPLVFERATASSSVSSGAPLKRTSDGKVETAGDGEFVVGIATVSADADEMVVMLVEGTTTVRYRSAITPTVGRRVRVAPSSEVDEGSGEPHHMGRFISHDSDDSTALISLRAGRANMNELGQLENDLDYDAMMNAKRFAVAMSAAMGG